MFANVIAYHLHTRTPIMSAPHLAVLVSFSGQGGVERSFALLMNALVDLGVRVDLLLIKRSSPHLSLVSSRVNRIELRHQHAATCRGEVAAYLRKEQPAALLVAKHRAIVSAVKAAAKAGFRGPVVGVIGINTSASIAVRSWPQRLLWRFTMRRHYPRLTRLIAVSDGVNADLCQLARLPYAQVITVRNPVLDDRMRAQAAEPLDHPWFGAEMAPVIVSVGRLSHSKDYATLLQAVALMTTKTARLVILGEGGDRPVLEQQIIDLQLEDRVLLPGFVENPFPWMRAAQVFALSSVIEGSGNVLVEAMALGTPVVSTDCPSGPAEILGGGRYGSLVPMKDAPALANALDKALGQPCDAELLRDATRAFEASTAARHYLQVMNIHLADEAH